MISLHNKFLFIHIPKTGGNSVAEFLLQYSDSYKTDDEKFDGVENFELRNKGMGGNKHSSLSFYENALDTDVFNGLYKFSTVRNPWDRAVSYYFFSTHSNKDEPINKSLFYEKLERLRPVENYSSTSLGNFESIDFYLRFETLSEDMERVASFLGIPFKGLNKRNASKRNNYRQYYTEQELIDFVGDKYRNEIDRFNYSI